jgi:dedicated sortase system histidine kinase
MSLRRQLLVASLLLLSLPWAGCQFIREMEGAMRKGQEESLQATASAVASVLGIQERFLYPYSDRRGGPEDRRKSIYAFPTETPVKAIEAMAQTRGDYLYLLLRVEDPEVVYHNPGLSPEPNGDRIMLRMWRNERRQEYVIATAAPGKVRAQAAGRRQRGVDAGRINGYWQDAVGGYTLELEIPLEFTGGRLGFYLVNESTRFGRNTEFVGSVSRGDTSAPPWLIYSPKSLQSLLAPFSKQGKQIMVVDRERWLLADIAPSHKSTVNGAETFWLLRLLYRSILSQEELPLPPPPYPDRPGRASGSELTGALAGTAANARYRDPDYATRTILSAAVPIVDSQGVLGAVLVRQSGETYLSLTDRAFSRLLNYSLLAIGITALGLLGYASLLSWRIRRLSLAASAAVRDDGQVMKSFPRSTAPDEIGELSRHYGDLLGRVREYNDYLRSLSRKLSHELRTPIAVIQSSLDNLDQAAGTPAAEVYRQRAREGLQRLQRILTSMSEASRLEESISNNRRERLDLVPLLKKVFEAYRGVYRQHRLLLNLQVDEAWITGVPDLLVQALDKLMDNAAAFSPSGCEIELGLSPVPEGWEISLVNEGASLPEDIQDRLFDPMVSERSQASDDVHLGIGLHVVRLIVDFHGGSARADNELGGGGVIVRIRLPAAEVPEVS